MGELFNSVIRDDTRAGLVAIVEALKNRNGIDGVILGGTELSLILKEKTCAGVPVLDTTQIHVNRIVREALA